MNFSQMKLSTKLSLAFFVLIVLTMVVGTISVFKMAQIDRAVNEITHNWLPSVKYAAAMRDAANQVRRIEPSHIMSDTPEEFAAEDKRLEEAKTRFAKAMETYRQNMTEPEERAAFADFIKAKDAYFAIQVKLLEESRKGEAGSEAAQKIFQGESRKAFNEMVGLITKIVDINDSFSDRSAAAAEAAYASARMQVIGLVLVSLVLAVLLAVLILRDVTGILGGEPAEARELAREVAAGNLNNQIRLKNGDTHSLMAALKAMQESLADIVSRVRSGSESVASASSQIAQGNQDLSSRTESQASALEETAASMEELGSTVQQNADNARQANQLAQSASGVATQGGQVVAQVVDTMKGISESSKKISDIISVIDSIAFQTNILALNAAVEAARAGEQGRGFAVVASEVRNLAGRSAEAAKEIKALITESVTRVDQGTALVDQAGHTMEEVVASIRRVTDIMGEISAASSEQSAGVSQVGEAVTQMDQATQQNAALVEEMAAAAGSLNTQAQDLVQAVAVFKLAQGQGFASAVKRAPAPQVAKAMPAMKPLPAIKSAPKKSAPAKVANLNAPAPAPALAAKTGPAKGDEQDWESF